MRGSIIVWFQMCWNKFRGRYLKSYTAYIMSKESFTYSFLIETFGKSYHTHHFNLKHARRLLTISYILTTLLVLNLKD